SGSIAGGTGNGGQADAITFTGGANTLRFLNNTSGLSGNIGVTGSLTFDQSGIDTTAANTITGTGSVAKTGNATITLSGANTYTGGTTVTSGTLQIGHVNALGTGPVTIDAGATLRSTVNATLLDSISGKGAGTSVLSAATGTVLTLGDGAVAF